MDPNHQTKNDFVSNIDPVLRTLMKMFDEYIDAKFVTLQNIITNGMAVPQEDDVGGALERLLAQVQTNEGTPAEAVAEAEAEVVVEAEVERNAKICQDAPNDADAGYLTDPQHEKQGVDDGSHQETNAAEAVRVMGIIRSTDDKVIKGTRDKPTAIPKAFVKLLTPRNDDEASEDGSQPTKKRRRA